MKKTLLLLSLFLSTGMSQAQTYKKFSKVQPQQQNDLSAYLFYAPSLFDHGHASFEAEEIKTEDSKEKADSKEEAKKITVGGFHFTHLLGFGADLRLSQLPNFSIGGELSLTKASHVLSILERSPMLNSHLMYSGVVKARHYYPSIAASSNFEFSPFFGMGLGIYLDNVSYDYTLIHQEADKLIHQEADKWGYRKDKMPTVQFRSIIQGTALVELGSRMSISDNMFAELGYSGQTFLSSHESIGTDSADKGVKDQGKPTRFVHSIKVGFGLKLPV